MADELQAEQAGQVGPPEPSAPARDDAPDDDAKILTQPEPSERDADAAMLTMLQNLPQEESRATPEDIDFSQTRVAPAEFQQLSHPAGQAEPKNIELLMDINLPVSIELGRTRMSVADILSLGPGAVVELNKLAGEPVDVLVNHKIVARGEVVVIDENFGVRVTQLMTPEERLKLLGEEE